MSAPWQAFGSVRERAGTVPIGVYLQVEAGNAAARSLYRRHGFADHHEYHYRVAPAAAANR